MVPQSQVRKTRNSSKTNLIISLVFHSALVIVVLYLAGRNGLLGTTIQNTLAVKTEKEKPEPPKKEEKKIEPPKIDEPKITTVPVQTPTVTAPTQANMAPAPAAPPPVDVPSFDIGNGDTVVDADPTTVYKGLIQSKFFKKWHPPGDLSDKKDLVTDVQMTLDASGRISNTRLTRTSGNQQWDNTVRQAIAEVAEVGQKPPKGFPSQVTVRFDVHEEEQDTTFQ